MKTTLLKGTALGAFLLLAACQTAEERAEGYYQSGLELLAAGDTARALVELRNVFEHDGFHKEARQTYVRLTLTEIALSRGDWREVSRHGTAAQELMPDAPRTRAITAAMTYREAIQLEDPVTATQAVAEARAVLDDLPDNIPALRIVIDQISQGATPADALPLIDRALAIQPASFEFHTAKLRLLTTLKDDPASIAQLEAMFARFPDNPDVRTTLVNWHLSQRNFDQAEDILRTLAGDPTKTAAGSLTVVQFLRQAKSDAAALAELDQLITAAEGTPPQDLYRAMSALIRFEQDPAGPALAQMAALTEGLDTSESLPATAAMWTR